MVSVWLAAASFNTVGAFSFVAPWDGKAVKLEVGLARDVGELVALLFVEAGPGERGGLGMRREKNLPLTIGELAGLVNEPKPIRLPRLLC